MMFTTARGHQTIVILLTLVRSSLARVSPSSSIATPGTQAPAEDVGGGWGGDGEGQQRHQPWSGHVMSGRQREPTSCMTIPPEVTLCRDIGYTEMRLPNLLGHDSIQEVKQQAQVWVHLRNVRCHPDTQLFLCSLFTPVCLSGHQLQQQQPHQTQFIWPCRSLCMAVKSSCEPVMQKYRFSWPDMIRCDQYPPDNEMCITAQSHSNPTEEACSICGRTATFAQIVNSFCDSEFALQIRLEAVTVNGSNVGIACGPKRKYYRTGSVSKKELQRTAAFYVSLGAQCPCIRELVQGRGRKPPTGAYLAMGRKVGNHLTLTYLQKFDRKSKDMNRAIRAIGNVTICNNGRHAVDDDVTASDSRKKSSTSGRKSVVAKKTGSGSAKVTRRKGIDVTTSMSVTSSPAGRSRDRIRSTTTGSAKPMPVTQRLMSSTTRPTTSGNRKSHGSGKHDRESRRSSSTTAAATT